MKLRTRIIFFSACFLAIFFSAAHIFLLLEGANIITSQLEKSTRQKIIVKNFEVRFPLSLEVKGLSIGSIININKAYLVPSFPRLLFGKLAFNLIKIDGLEFTYEKIRPPEPKTAENIPSTPVVPPPVKAPFAVPSVFKLPRLICKQLIVQNGTVNFIDHSAGKEGIKITAKGIFLNFSNIYLPFRPVVSNFELRGRIPWQAGIEEGKIEAGGWANLFKRDMSAVFKINDIDGVYLYPYYSQWVDLEKSRIEKAKLNFTSNINAFDNKLTAECHLELSDIVRRPLSPEEVKEKEAKIADAVLGAFKDADQGKIVLDFTIRTKLDKPRVGFNDIKDVVEDKLAALKDRQIDTTKILLLPAKLWEGAVKGSTEIVRLVFKGTVAVGRGVKHTVKDVLPGAHKKDKKLPAQ